jgi:hypothetical protein
VEDVDDLPPAVLESGRSKDRAVPDLDEMGRETASDRIEYDEEVGGGATPSGAVGTVRNRRCCSGGRFGAISL